MNDTQLYYTAPSQEIFDEVKEEALNIWNTYDNTYGYASEKMNRVNSITNISDNVMTIIAMFDSSNQAKLASKLTPEARKAVADRIKDGGTPDYFNPFI